MTYAETLDAAEAAALRCNPKAASVLLAIAEQRRYQERDAMQFNAAIDLANAVAGITYINPAILQDYPTLRTAYEKYTAF